MKFKLFSILVIVSLVTVFGGFSKINIALASCDPTGNPPATPPSISSISEPRGTYNNPTSVPIVISGEGGYQCTGDPRGGLGWEDVATRVVYTITDTRETTVFQGYWNSDPCTVPICVIRQIDINTSADSTSWPAGNYVITATATGPDGLTATASGSFIIERTEVLPTFSTSCTPATQTIQGGSTTSFNLSTTGSGGFNSPVTFTASINPSTGTLPTISFTNNGAVPDATTTAVITTTGSTTNGTYTITFTGTGGGVTKNCSVQLVVGSVTPPGGFSFTITPNPKAVPKGENAQFTVTAVCGAGFNGTINNLSASSPAFGTLNPTFSPTSVTCVNPVTTLTIPTGAVTQGLSPSINDLRYQTLTVTGQGISNTAEN